MFKKDLIKSMKELGKLLIEAAEITEEESRKNAMNKKPAVKKVVEKAISAYAKKDKKEDKVMIKKAVKAKKK